MLHSEATFENNTLFVDSGKSSAFGSHDFGQPDTFQPQVSRCRVNSRLVTTLLSSSIFSQHLVDRDLSAYLIHSHLDIFLLMNYQLTRRADKGNLIV